LNLINWGYDIEDNILKKPLHTIISRYRWFAKKRKEEKEEQLKFQCPWLNIKTKKKK